MAYLSLYRKWRPQRFSDVVGQAHVVTTLKNALNTGRTSHAYLFAGPRGTGKTTLARLLAKGLNCASGPTGDPCGECDNCQRIAKGYSVDVIEIDGASNRGIDEIRDVREKVRFAPAEGRFKVYIIDEVHMLTQEAFNALLKVLEEPPGHVVFVFATTEPHRIPATILSRCQKFDFHAFSPAELVEQLRTIAAREGVEVEDGALNLIARHSEGGMRDALSYLDQCIAFASGTVTESLAAQVLGVVERDRLDELAECLLQREVGRALALVKQVLDSGRDLRQFAKDAVLYFRDLMLLKAAPGSEALVALAPWEKERAREMAGRFDLAYLLKVLEGLGRAESEMRWAQSAQIPLEMALIELVCGSGEESGPGASASAGAASLGAATPGAARSGAGARIAAVDSERIQRLEERIARLEALLSVEGRTQDREQREDEVPRPAAAALPAEEVRPAGGARPEREPGAPEAAISEAAAPANAAGPAKILIPADTGGAGSGGDDAPGDPFFEEIRGRWPAFLEFLRTSRHVQQEAFLREGTPGRFEEGELTVFFSPNHRFHQANVAHERNRAVVEQALRKFFGREIALKAVLGEPPPEASPGRRGRAEGEARAVAAQPMEARSGLQQPSAPAAAASTRAGSQASGPAPGTARGPATSGSQELPDEFDEPLLRAALKLFGGTITKLERKESDGP